MKLSLPPKVVEKPVWVPIILLPKIFSPIHMADGLLCRNGLFLSPNQETLQKPNSNISKTASFKNFIIRVGEGSTLRAFLNLWQQRDVTGVERSGMKLCLRSNQKNTKGKRWWFFMHSCLLRSHRRSQ